jgi:hypothetical protein
MNKENIWNATVRLDVSASSVGISRPHLLLAIVVGLCCSAGLLLTANPTLNQAGLIDPYLYVGYTNDYAGLLERFGPTYYADRIAYIFPARAFNYLFGLEVGYFALRFVALAAAASAVFIIGLRFCGFAVALLAAVWLTFTPGLPRGLLWTYVDGFAVAYLLVGAAFLVVPIRRRLICHVAAGAAFGLAVNCNIFVFAICGLLGPGWAFFYRRQRIAWFARAVLLLALGFLAAHLALALMAYAQVPKYGLTLSFESFRSVISLIGVGAEFYPFSSNWEDHSFTLLIPVTFGSAAFLSVARRSAIVPVPADPADFAVFAVCHLGAVILLSLVSQFAFHDSWMSVQFYRTYFVPGSIFALMVIGGQAQRYGGRILGSAALYCGSTLIVLLWLAFPVLPHLEIESGWSLWLALALATIVAATVLHRTAAASVVLVVGSVLLSQCFYDSDNSTYYWIRDRPREQEAVEWDVYRGAFFLHQFLDGYVRPKQAIGFWYSGNREAPWKLLNSIQATYLWGFTRMFSKGQPGMPLVDEEFRRQVVTRQFVVLLGVSDAENDEGLKALEEAHLHFHEVSRA